ncbi:MAG: CotH kinase family protein [Lachnospiraceae bacterium]|nr:CotH kinase family protein [Lachnospiraceae bacterium]
MKKKFSKYFIPLLLQFLLFCLLTGCGRAGDPADARNTGEAEDISDLQEEGPAEQTDDRKSGAQENASHMADSDVTVEKVEKAPLSESNITEDKALYGGVSENSVITMYLTTKSGNKADGTDHTWSEINRYSVYDYEKMGVDRYKVDGILSVDETGEGILPGCFGYGQDVPNVSVQVRGQTSSRSDQKNFKIRIKDGKGTFRGQRTLNLNKHKADPYRFLNKLCYDLLDPIPQLIGGRTQFVHLYVKDETAGGSGYYVDYGLFTMVEQVNKSYFRRRGLDENGHFYKVTFFEWDYYDAVMTDVNDPDFDKNSFEKYLEIKGDEDPEKLQEVIRKVQNYSIPIEDIIDEHFDSENICYWMAFNILNGNNDVGARNLFLYSPLNSQKFYMICWDMDASFKNNYNRRKEYYKGINWETGMTKFLGLELINRMMKEEKYRKQLEDAVEDLYHNYMTADIVAGKVEGYKEVTSRYCFQMPDVEYMNFDTVEEYQENIALIASEVDENYRIFRQSMKSPWPFFTDIPTLDDEGKMELSWGVSYDYEGQNITYDYILASDIDFENVISSGQNLTVPCVTIDRPGQGTYYLRVTARNSAGLQMMSFDYQKNPRHGKTYGCYAFTIDSAGRIKDLE